MTKTYYRATKERGVWLRYWYDRHYRHWVCYLVNSPDDNGDQISNSIYCPRREQIVFDEGYYLRTK